MRYAFAFFRRGVGVLSPGYNARMMPKHNAGEKARRSPRTDAIGDAVMIYKANSKQFR
jgi:hypothetical protein